MLSIFATAMALPRWAKLAIGALALLAMATTLHRCAISNAVEADRKAAQGEVATKALEAERAANRADVARQAEISANDAATRKAINDATAKNPDQARAPAGPVSRSAADSLRNREAGANPATD